MTDTIWLCLAEGDEHGPRIRAWTTDPKRAGQLRADGLDMVEYRCLAGSASGEQRPAAYVSRLDLAKVRASGCVNTILTRDPQRPAEGIVPVYTSAPPAAGWDEARNGIYIASKTKHAERWKALRASGLPIVSTWVDEAGEGESADLHDLWRRCLTEAAGCQVLIAYREDGEVFKGGWVEIGAALSVGIPVYAVGLDGFTIAKYRGITHFTDLESAVASACAALRREAPTSSDEIGMDWKLSDDAKARVEEIDANRRNAYLNTDNIVAGSSRPDAGGGVREAALAKAAQDFIDKVDRGEARSKSSYAAFKAALTAPPAAVESNASAEARLREALEQILRYCDKSTDPAIRNVAQQALSPSGDKATTYRVDYDGFVGTKIGTYRTREGREGVVLQQADTKIVHVYGANRVEEVGSEAKKSGGGCICQEQHRRGYCTEPGCPYAVRPSDPTVDRREIVARLIRGHVEYGYDRANDQQQSIIGIDEAADAILTALDGGRDA